MKAGKCMIMPLHLLTRFINKSAFKNYYKIRAIPPARSRVNEGIINYEKYCVEAQMIRKLIGWFITAFSIALLAHPVLGNGSQNELNKKVVLAFYEQAINQKDFAAASKYLGPRYIQHNQRAGDGIDGLKNFITFLQEKFPQSHSTIKRVFANGDYVILHVHAIREPGTRGMAIIDIFRLDKGKVVEHWDVHEDIIENPANGNGMF
jgi:predicted SnoaL-like aldol condensation-catalyzing enzyme